MAAQGAFNLVALDDEIKNAEGVIEYARQKGLGEPFVFSKAVDRIQGCLDLPAEAGWNGEWLFILDCDLKRTGEGGHGGFAAWSNLVEREPVGRAAFAIIYSQSVLDLVEAVNKGGDRAKLVQRPQIYSREIKDDGTESWWDSLTRWLSERQTYLISSADLNRRAEISAQLKQCLNDTPKTALDKLSETLEIRIPAKKYNVVDNKDWIENWEISRLFPAHAEFIKRAAEGNVEIRWQEYVLQICYALLPQFRSVVSELLTLIYTDLRQSPRIDEREVGNIIGGDIYHASSADIDTDISKNFCRSEVWEWFQFRAKRIKKRLQSSYTLLSPSIAAPIESDPFNKILDELCAANSGGDILDCIDEQLTKNYIFGKARRAWSAVDADPRKQFCDLPVLSSVADLIEGTINMQAKKHGNLHAAKQFKPVGSDNKVFLIFQTQQNGEGALLDPDIIIKKCREELNNPKPTHLAGLVEVICGNMGGEIYVMQEPRTSEYTTVFHASKGVLTKSRTSTVPKELMHLTDKMQGGEIETDFDDEGVCVLKGTYYVIVLSRYN